MKGIPLCVLHGCLVLSSVVACAEAGVRVQPVESPAAVLDVVVPAGDVIRLRRVPAGQFVMGSPETEIGRYRDEGQQSVTLTRDFFIGETEITRGQWHAVMGGFPDRDCSPCATGTRQPMTCIDWNDVAGADGFLERLNEHLARTEQLLQGARVRLPTEAEWEFAARAGTTSRFSFGDADGCQDGCEPCDAASSYINWCGLDLGCSLPVASLAPNQLGLYDMHGNVWEWVADRFAQRGPHPVVDPVGPSRGSHYVIRGCSFVNALGACRSAARNADAVTHRGDVLGFRVALTFE